MSSTIEPKINDYRSESKELLVSDESKCSNSSKVNASMTRKAKIDKLRLDHSATSIQASWRGKSYRTERNSKKDGLDNTLEGDATEMQNVNICTEVDSTIGNKFVSEKSYSNDGKFSDIEDENEEENLAIARAEGQEEIELERVKSNNKLLTWPDSHVDDFDDPDWPDLGPPSSSSGMSAFCNYSSHQIYYCYCRYLCDCCHNWCDFNDLT